MKTSDLVKIVKNAVNEVLDERREDDLLISAKVTEGVLRNVIGGEVIERSPRPQQGRIQAQNQNRSQNQGQVRQAKVSSGYGEMPFHPKMMFENLLGFSTVQEQEGVTTDYTPSSFDDEYDVYAQAGSQYKKDPRDPGIPLDRAFPTIFGNN